MRVIQPTNFGRRSLSRRPGISRLLALLALACSWVVLSPLAAQAQGVALITTTNPVQMCTGDAFQPAGEIAFTPVASGTILNNSSIILTYGGTELSGTPSITGTGAASITATRSGNVVTLRFTADVAYPSGSRLSISGVSVRTLGASLGSSIGVAVTSSTANPGSPITFTSAFATIGAMISCDISIDSGDGQSGTVDTSLGQPFSVLTTPCRPGASVFFTVTAGGGTVTPAIATVNAQCKATATLRLGTKSGLNTVTARADIAPTLLTFRANGLAGLPTGMTIVSGNNQTGLVGQRLAAPFIIRVFDFYDNPVPDILFAFDILEGAGTLTSYEGQTEADGQVQTFLRLGTTPGNNRVKATANAVPGREVFFTATGQPIVATTIVISSGNGQTGVPGQTLQPFVVRVIGQDNIPVGGIPVTFNVASGGGVLSDTQLQTDASGLASTVLTMGPQQGVNAVTATSGSLINSPLTFNALATGSGRAPVIFTGGIVNGASFRPSGSANANVAPGTLVAIFGSELAQSEQSAQTTPLPTTLGDTTITFNGIPAPLFFVSPGQINAQVPWNLPTGDVAVRIRRSFLEVPSQTVPLTTYSPGIFTVNRNGSGVGAILHADTFLPVTDTNRTGPGRRIAVFMTGLGPVNPPAASGQPAPTPAATTISSVLANIGGSPAVVEFSGLAPGFVGLYQVNLLVPAGTPAGNQDLVISVNGVPSNTVTLPVQ